MKVSFAIPLYHEEEVIPELLSRLRAVLDSLGEGPHEVLLVDDGSSDQTYETVLGIVGSDTRFCIIRLSRNFGHQAAITAALERCTGDRVVVMDGDLQDPPEVIPSMLAELDAGYDVVYARRVARKENCLLRACYKSFYKVLGFLSNFPIPSDTGDFAAMTGRVVQELNKLPEHRRFVRGLRSWVGFRQKAIDIERKARTRGTSKYTPSRLFCLAADGILSFSTAPLRLATLVGLLATFVSSLFVIYAIWAKLFWGRSPDGFTSLVTLLAFFFGLQVLFFGVLGEYIGRIYDEVKGRPLYIVGSIHQAGKDESRLR